MTGARRNPEPGLLLASVLGLTTELVDRAVRHFADQFGASIFDSDPLAFDYTDYYSDELGPQPARRFVALKPLLDDPSRLAEIKRATCRMEVSLGRRGGARQVNIDPGYLTADKLVLASTKPRAHRIYLGRGVHADLMLIYRDGAYCPLPWTYPDYASAELLQLMARLRELYLATRREPADPSGAP